MFAELATTVSLHCTLVERQGANGPDIGTERYTGRIYVDYDRRYGFFDIEHPEFGQHESHLVLVTDEAISLYSGFVNRFNEIDILQVNRSTGELRIGLRGIREWHQFRGTCEPGPEITPPQAPTPKF